MAELNLHPPAEIAVRLLSICLSGVPGAVLCSITADHRTTGAPMRQGGIS
jgi:hypothetical protein